ncbi:hypothetical protein BKA69DRAFT_1071883 [Paraphysoderma sedebokerense]|nr:hypothetical protein BKA69DRAFT_1071883 [Paraphysoderma sedebokerense]
MSGQHRRSKSIATSVLLLVLIFSQLCITSAESATVNLVARQELRRARGHWWDCFGRLCRGSPPADDEERPPVVPPNPEVPQPADPVDPPTPLPPSDPATPPTVPGDTGFPHPIPSSCDNVVVRKEWRNCSPEEKKKFISALSMLRQFPSRAGTASRYDDFVAMYAKVTSQVLGEPYFFPYHRYFVFQLEKELQSLGPEFKDVFVPYWQFTADGGNPRNAPVWGDDEVSFGRGDKVNQNGALRSGAFAKWGVKRSWKNGKLSAWTGEEELLQIMQDNSDYDDFRAIFEGLITSDIRKRVAGSGGDLVSDQAPKDPLFWLMYANVDQVYSAWQSASPRRFNSYNGRYFFAISNPSATPNDKLPGFSVTVKDMFDTKRLCYAYEK